MEPASAFMDKSGNLYGTTRHGGANGSPNLLGGGTVFSLTPPATVRGKWTESIVWSFGSGADGNSPQAGLILDAGGNLFSTTENGGAHATNSATGGTVFEIQSVLTASPDQARQRGSARH